ncbi:MAG TPA: ATP phosphoribosyltransferase [Beijerinckiaceae bacterium]|nr:ATP phosphoribosyltransferase [Beijerinckiaceae bacterium]
MTNVPANGAPLILAVPSKGRLQENANAFFARAGLVVVQGRGVRDYRGALGGVGGVEIAFISASEITQQLAVGAVHMGVTGEDLVRETVPGADDKMAFLTPLGFGHANVVVAVPQAWIDVKTMVDLEDVAAAYRARRGERMRVATKYVNLTRRFFAERGVMDYRIVESLGATEGAPAAGQAELIVDITTTGATLRANGLKQLDDGVILRSEANLVASMAANWSDQQRGSARALLSRIAAEEEARTTREVRAIMAGDRTEIAQEAGALFEARALFGAAGEGPLTLVCPRSNAAALADWLLQRGAEHVAVGALDYVFSARNALYDKLARRWEQA